MDHLPDQYSNFQIFLQCLTSLTDSLDTERSQCRFDLLKHMLVLRVVFATFLQQLVHLLFACVCMCVCNTFNRIPSFD